nr:hypothetical protein CFP56_01259 [Quercus suber]
MPRKAKHPRPQRDQPSRKRDLLQTAQVHTPAPVKYTSTNAVGQPVCSLGAPVQKPSSLARDLAAEAHQRGYNTRVLIEISILLLLAFGTLYTLAEYLLLAIRVSACSPVTVFVPVTSTATVVTCPSLSSSTYTVGSTSTITVTSTSVLTNYHTTTISPEISAATALTSSGGPSYFYSIVSGTTNWLNGVSPSSGMALATVTTSIVVLPLSTVPDTTVHLTSTSILTETITAPEYTSTVYSFAPVDLTTTSYSTIYTTISVYDATTVSVPRFSFHSLGDHGWNATSQPNSLRPTGTETAGSERTTTMTGIYFWGTDSRTTSTSTRYLTTTLHVTRTTTLWTDSSLIPTESETSSDNPSPITISYAALTSFQTFTPGTSGIFESSKYPASEANLSSKTPSLVASPTGHSIVTANESAVYGSDTANGVNHPDHVTSSVPTRTITSGPIVSVAQAGPTAYGTPSTFPMNSTIDLYSMSASASSYVSAGQSTSAASTAPAAWSASFFNNGGSSLSPLSSVLPSPYVPLVLSTLSTASSILSYMTGYPASTSVISATSGSAAMSVVWTTENTSSLSGHLQTSIQSFLPSHGSPPSYQPQYSSATTSELPSMTASKAQSRLSQSANLTIAVNTGISTITTAASSSPAPPTSATGRPSSCGESGPFVLTFDDLPNFNPTRRNNTDITQAPPIPNPYNHLTFSDGYVYAPQPNESYAPQSNPHLAVFLANGRGMTTSTMPTGEIADGMYESSSAFWFDAQSVWLGCDNIGPEECTIMMTGYTWSTTAAKEIAAFEENTTISACPNQTKCALQQRLFPTSFVGLSGLQMQAYVGTESRMFFLDDLALSWTNNTCQAGLIRQTHR